MSELALLAELVELRAKLLTQWKPHEAPTPADLANILNRLLIALINHTHREITASKS